MLLAHSTLDPVRCLLNEGILLLLEFCECEDETSNSVRPGSDAFLSGDYELPALHVRVLRAEYVAIYREGSNLVRNESDA
jgi:hypothetical protein